MTRPVTRHLRFAGLALATMAAGALLAACGDGSTPPGTTQAPVAAAAPASAATGARTVRYVSRDQLALELDMLGPLALVLSVPHAHAVESAVDAADRIREYSGQSERLSIFVDAHDPVGDGATVATRLQRDQGWAHVFVVR